MTYEPDAWIAALFRDAGISAAAARIHATVDRFDNAMLAAAATAVPDNPSAITQLFHGAIDPITYRAELVPRQLLTSAALARILGALQLIETELDCYLADRDVVHLSNALGDGMQNLFQALRQCFGFWRLPKDPARPGLKIRHLSLQLAIADGREDAHAGPALKILVDGKEMLARVGARQYSGFPAADLLGMDTPLLPAEPPRFVPLYREAGCRPVTGCLAAIIHTYGDNIAWNAFRRFDDFYTPAMQPEPDDGSPFGRPRAFNGAQYRAEVQRAKAELDAVMRSI